MIIVGQKPIRCRKNDLGLEIIMLELKFKCECGCSFWAEVVLSKDNQQERKILCPGCEKTFFKKFFINFSDDLQD